MKRKATRALPSAGFAYAARAFFDPNRLIQPDTRYGYGEERYQPMGKIEHYENLNHDD